MTSGSEAADELWAFVSEEAAALTSLPVPDAVLRELDRRIVAASDGGWELGPTDDGGVFLALTCEGDRSRLDRIRELVASAPAVRGLEIRVGRPAREWNFVVTLGHEWGDGGTRTVDCGSWLYVLEVFPDDRVGIRISPGPGSERVEVGGRVAALALEMTLGEAFDLERIEYAEFLDELPPDVREFATELRYLAEHIESLGLR